MGGASVGPDACVFMRTCRGMCPSLPWASRATCRPTLLQIQELAGQRVALWCGCQPWLTPLFPLPRVSPAQWSSPTSCCSPCPGSAALASPWSARVPAAGTAWLSAGMAGTR